jgi:HAE1 family hydrophobic/amphiphilic exporter-1
LRDEGPFGPVTGTVPGGYGDAVSTVFGRDFPTWTIGANVSYPLFNRSARAANARSRVTLEQARVRLKRLELQIAAEVRAAARAVETNFKRVDSTGAAKTLSTRRLDAEEKKFAAGMSTSFLVTQAQRDLALAEVNELRAIADYRKSLITFERVQQSAGGSVSFASSSGGATASASSGRSGAGTADTSSGFSPF